jgi:hypothetical protein
MVIILSALFALLALAAIVAARLLAQRSQDQTA